MDQKTAYFRNIKLESYLTTHTSLSPIRREFAPGFVNCKKGAHGSQSQVIKFTSCLPMIGGSLRVLRLLPSLKLVAMILLQYCWMWSETSKSINYRNNSEKFISKMIKELFVKYLNMNFFNINVSQISLYWYHIYCFMRILGLWSWL